MSDIEENIDYDPDLDAFHGGHEGLKAANRDYIKRTGIADPNSQPIAEEMSLKELQSHIEKERGTHPGFDGVYNAIERMLHQNN